MNVRTGQPGPWPQPTEFGQTDAGTYSVIPWEDVDANKINQLAAQFQTLGYNYRVTHGFGKSRVEVQLSYNQLLGTEVPVDLWEYNGRSTPKDLLQAVTNTGITGTLTPSNISVIRNALNGTFPTNAPKDANGVQYLDSSTNSFDSNGANALTIYQLMKSGFSDYPIRCPILRHTQTVSQFYPIFLSQLNVGKIISTSTLFSLETVPGWALNGLPNIAPPAFSDGKLFAFGWFKDDANINQIAYRKVSIVQEFQYGLWPTAVFGQPL